MTENINTHADYLDLIAQDLLDTPFKGEEEAVLTHFLNSGHTIPYVSEGAYEKITASVGIPSIKKNKFTFIDLFAGIGGFRLALGRNGGAPVFSSEWNGAAKKTYFENYGEFPFGDINKFTNENVLDNELGALIPSHDTPYFYP